MMQWTSELRDDLKFGVRQLRRAPAFTAVAAATLALGIGANSAIFALVDATLLRPLPYRDPERLVRLYERNERSQRRVSHSDSLPGSGVRLAKALMV
jgi:putative ABC transport system permease protein